MGLSMRVKRAIAESVAKRYQKARKKEKSVILKEFVKTTGYNRKYASYLLANWGKRIRLWKKGQMFILVLGVRPKRFKRSGKKFYSKALLKPLKKLWALSGFLCGKRLKVFIGDNLISFEKEKDIVVTKEQEQKLFKIGAATIDRMLAGEKKKLLLKARSGTKPGTWLKNQIPIKTFTEWDRTKPGFVSIDLVSHEGGNASGEFLQTLDVTDVCTQWTETQGVLNKAQIWVFGALIDIRNRMPFAILGIHSDGGGEFINKPLFVYCNQEKLTFTHSRANKKNDNCWVEQKNYTVVRKTVAYMRYEGEKELKVLNDIYKRLRLITNFFIPSMKLISKTRIGSKVTKKYDKPKTPYKRVLESAYVDAKVKKHLKKQRLSLNMVQLRKEMLFLQEKLWKMAIKRKKPEPKFISRYSNSGFPYDDNFVYNFK